MDVNLYALERQVETKLAEARAVSAHQALVSSAGAARGTTVSSLLARLVTWMTRRRQHDLRRTTRLSTPTVP